MFIAQKDENGKVTLVEPEWSKKEREENEKLPHILSLGTRVMVKIENHISDGFVGYVCAYRRDCDGTPLYGLCSRKSFVNLNWDHPHKTINEIMENHYVDEGIVFNLSRDCLEII